MDVTVHFRYVTPDVIPPRCRKPRDVEGRGTVTVTVPEVTAADAPVAFRLMKVWANEPNEYRWWDERLWIPHLPWSRQTEPTVPGSPQFPAERTNDYYAGSNGETAATAKAAESMTDFLIIDGIVWQEAGEPRYVVMTFGMGHNHGGTSLSVHAHYNSNIHRDRYYRADQFAQARAEAMRVAAARGDTDDLPRLKALDHPIRVLIPAAVRCQPDVEHGEGDPFLNRLEAITQVAPSAEVAGVLGLMHLAAALTDS